MRSLPPASLILRSTSSVLALAAALVTASSARAQEIYELGFEEQPSYYGPKQVTLTFDDGPGWAPQHTLSVLDVLKEHGVRATFFINTGNQATGIMDGNADAKNAVVRIVEEGHELATHTLNHKQLINLADAEVDTEINGVEGMVTALGVSARISMFRAPYGEPYQWQFQKEQLQWEVPAGVEKYATIAPIAARTMVHIGWNIDSDDWKCSNDEAGGQCMVDNVVAKLEKGHYGNILMHSISGRTAAGLPQLIQYLNDHDYELVGTEYAICKKYGASSANLIDGKDGGCTTDGGDGDTGDGDTGDGDTGDGDTGDGDTGDGDTGDGDTGDGDTGDGDNGDGDNGDGDDNNDEDEDDEEDEEDVIENGASCSVSPGLGNGFSLLGGLSLALLFVRRRKQRS